MDVENFILLIRVTMCTTHTGCVLCNVKLYLICMWDGVCVYASLVVCVDCHTQVRLYIDQSTGLEYHLSSALYHHNNAHGNILTLPSDLNAFIRI